MTMRAAALATSAGTEHFAGMAKNRVQQAGGDDEVAQNVPARIQDQTNERFHVGIVAGVGVNVLAPIVGGVLGILGFAVRRSFAQCQNPKFAELRHSAGGLFLKPTMAGPVLELTLQIKFVFS
jgi:hypothetical protein